MEMGYKVISAMGLFPCKKKKSLFFLYFHIIPIQLAFVYLKGDISKCIYFDCMFACLCSTLSEKNVFKHVKDYMASLLSD